MKLNPEYTRPSCKGCCFWFGRCYLIVGSKKVHRCEGYKTKEEFNAEIKEYLKGGSKKAGRRKAGAVR